MSLTLSNVILHQLAKNDQDELVVHLEIKHLMTLLQLKILLQNYTVYTVAKGQKVLLILLMIVNFPIG